MAGPQGAARSRRRPAGNGAARCPSARLCCTLRRGGSGRRGCPGGPGRGRARSGPGASRTAGSRPGTVRRPGRRRPAGPRWPPWPGRRVPGFSPGPSRACFSSRAASRGWPAARHAAACSSSADTVASSLGPQTCSLWRAVSLQDPDRLREAADGGQGAAEPCAGSDRAAVVRAEDFGAGGEHPLGPCDRAAGLSGGQQCLGEQPGSNDGVGVAFAEQPTADCGQLLPPGGSRAGQAGGVQALASRQQHAVATAR